MLLIIDNHDSFTFNLVELFRQIGLKVGQDMVICSVDNLDEMNIELFSHILISPGPDVPRAYPQLFTMLSHFYQTKSILGVCLGHQTLCEFFGGQLYNLNFVRHGQQRQLQQIIRSPLFADLPEQFNIGLYHSWAINADSLTNTPLQVTASCDQEVVMAIQHHTLPIYGVQFHPESFITEFGKNILQNWLNT